MRFEDLFAIQMIVDEQRPQFEKQARELFDQLTPVQRFFAWAQYHDWRHTKIAEHLNVGLSRVSNLQHQYILRFRKAIDPTWTHEELRAFFEVWYCLLHHEPRPTLPEARS